LPVAEIDDANVDAWLDALRIQVLEEAGLVLELIWGYVPRSPSPLA